MKQLLCAALLCLPLAVNAQMFSFWYQPGEDGTNNDQPDFVACLQETPICLKVTPDEMLQAFRLYTEKVEELKALEEEKKQQNL